MAPASQSLLPRPLAMLLHGDCRRKSQCTLFCYSSSYKSDRRDKLERKAQYRTQRYKYAKHSECLPVLHAQIWLGSSSCSLGPLCGINLSLYIHLQFSYSFPSFKKKNPTVFFPQDNWTVATCIHGFSQCTCDWKSLKQLVLHALCLFAPFSHVGGCIRKFITCKHRLDVNLMIFCCTNLIPY